jgi:hypothetical protein
LEPSNSMFCPLFPGGWADWASTAYRINLDEGIEESKIENRNIAAMQATKKIQTELISSYQKQ